MAKSTRKTPKASPRRSSPTVKLIKIFLINNTGGGWADNVEVPEGTTAATLFSQQTAGAAAANFLIRVNRLPVTPETVLMEGDRMSITAKKIEGAKAA